MLPLSPHAEFEMKRRGISREAVEEVFHHPEQKIELAGAREIWQNKSGIAGKIYVVRLVVQRSPELKIVTVYKSSKIKKYWKENA